MGLGVIYHVIEAIVIFCGFSQCGGGCSEGKIRKLISNTLYAEVIVEEC